MAYNTQTKDMEAYVLSNDPKALQAELERSRLMSAIIFEKQENTIQNQKKTLNRMNEFSKTRTYKIVFTLWNLWNRLF